MVLFLFICVWRRCGEGNEKKRKQGVVNCPNRLSRVWVGIVNMFCDYIFYFYLSLEGGNNDGSYLHNMWGKKKNRPMS